MNYKKLINPLGKITLVILIGITIYEMMNLFQDEGAIIDVIGPISVIMILYVLPKLVNSKSK
jgi:hypothetical protein